MNTATKVWERGQAIPENSTHLTTAPPHWFEEEPEYAAELYGLERGGGVYTVMVLDNRGTYHEFQVSVFKKLTASVSGHVMSKRENVT